MASATPATILPLRTIPGSYGLPVLGPLKDRLDYFWFQGAETFFRDRMLKHKSSVFRTNMPPTFPFFINTNPKVIAVLDTKSFSTLFDISLVEKKDVLVGDYMPSTSFTGNLRVLAYLDPSEPRHSPIKSFAMDVLKSSSRVWVSELQNNLQIMWESIELDLAKNGTASFILPLQKCIFRFLTMSLVGADPNTRPEIGEAGFAVLDSWLALQLLPTTKVGVIPQPLEELLLHSLPFPAFLVKPGYNKLYKFIEEEGKEVILKGQKEYGLTKEETIHNLLFVLGFNAFGGFSVFLPTLLSTVGRDKTGLQEKLRVEVREKGKSGLSFETVGQMDLLKSTVYEVLRLNPPVPLQYARARKNFMLSSHDSSYEIQKGELLCGYQPLVMRDPNMFLNPEEFVADRFTEGRGGKELLNSLFWSNGPQTGTPSTSNKQCAAKDYVVATAALVLAWIFTRYDEFTCDDSSLTITQAVKASSTV
ncbi:putative inactive linolenate hydroperoxide lyase [Cinnamomum micranthum f. kanehirae]|uniref:Putative inactive linolenate hydroperoxide lyase n=1 Tax=Cinnamomum micranthum f. kanehirae TaxID=337451 RepID=A0A3S3R6H3_9MAGN|nr:putative inactive linolenate hydroperoxide lyase [Cinnamomum micranthum f. kanehirae]